VPIRPPKLPRRVAIALAVATLLAVGLAAATTASAQSPPSYAFENRGTHGVLDVAGESTAAGARVVDWPWHGRLNQRWRPDSPVTVGDLHYTRLVAGHSGQCLDLNGGKALFGVAIVQNPCNTSHSQQWRIEYVGGFQVNSYFRLIPRAAEDKGLVAVVSQWSPGPGQELVLAFKGSATSVYQHFYLRVL
jgi:hypothetical protein